MGRARSPYGYKASSLNAMKHGVLVDGILRSRGYERCPHSRTCQVARDPILRAACQPGGLCPTEAAFHGAYIKDARRSFSFCLAWLPEEDFEKILAGLAIVSLQRQRLSALVAKEGFTRPKVHPVSGVAYGIEESLGAGRYATTLNNQFERLMCNLLGRDAREAPDRDSTPNK